MEITKESSSKSPKAVPLDEATHKLLSQLAKAHGRSLKQFTADMVAYFKATGLDPCDIKVQNTAAAIQALDRRLISFIKTQEKEKLNPLLDELSIVARKLSGFLNDYARQTHIDLLEGKVNDSQEQLLKWLKGMYHEIMGVKNQEGKVEKTSLRYELRTLAQAQVESIKLAQQARQDSLAGKEKARQLFADYLREIDNKSALVSRKPIDEKYLALFANL